MGNSYNPSRSTHTIDEDTLKIIADTNKEIENQLKRRNRIKAKIKRCVVEAEQLVKDGEDKEALRVLADKRKQEELLAQNWGMTNRLKTMVEDAEKMKNISDVKKKEDAIAALLGRYQRKADPLSMMEQNIAIQQMHKDVDTVAGLASDSIAGEDPYEAEEVNEELLKIKQKQNDAMLNNIKTPSNAVGSDKVSQKKPVKMQDGDVAELEGDLLN